MVVRSFRQPVFDSYRALRATRDLDAGLRARPFPASAVRPPRLQKIVSVIQAVVTNMSELERVAVLRSNAERFYSV